MKILVQICSNHEWEITKSILKANEFFRSPYGEYFVSEIASQEVIFFHSGVSKTRSAAACQYAISHWNPKMVFCFGTAGSVSIDLNPLDLILVKTTVQYDCIDRMDPSSSPFYEDMITEMDLSWINIENLAIEMKTGLIATAD